MSSSSLFLFLVLLSLSSANILSNPSFEEGFSHWKCKERPNLWNIVDPSPELLSISVERSSTGTKSFQIRGAISGSSERALFASQFVSDENLRSKSSTNSVLVIEWASMLKIANRSSPSHSTPYVLVDIEYSDGELFYIKQAIATEESSDFVFNCIQVPSSQSIGSLMLSIVVEGDFSGVELFVDDVSVDFASENRDFNSCPLYENSHPIWRPTKATFLKRQIRQNQKQITLATQLTLDRLSSLERLAKVWLGPISASLLLFRNENGPKRLSNRESLKELIRFHQSSVHVRNHVDVHVVFEDVSNDDDSSLYPVNYLRNFAIKSATTAHVYYVDVDILPSTSEQQLRAYIDEARESIERECSRCAFITPIFTSKSVVDQLPTKEDFLVELQKPDSQFKAFAVVSHAIVNYHKWYKELLPYEVGYRENVEPYFVVKSDAPLMNPMFAGYGRDKCSYSRELNAAGYQFIVLPQVYAVNLPEERVSVQRSILSRNSGGPLVRLRVFLNTIFQEYSMAQRYRTDEEQNDSDSDSETPKPKKDLDESATQLPVYGIKCDLIWKDEMQIPLPPDDGHRQTHHRAAIIDSLVKEFDPKVFVQLGTHRDLNMMILMHWDAVVAIRPGEYLKREEETRGIIASFSGGDVEDLIRRAKGQFQEPMLFWIESTDSAPGSDNVYDLLARFLRSASSHDILAINGLSADEHKLLWTTVCDVSRDWTLHQRGSAVIVRTVKAISAPLLNLPPIPPIALDPVEPSCNPDSLTTDVVLFTRDRPVQTLAFLESLVSMGVGLNKVWILYRADGTVFERSYRKAVDCVSNYGIDIELVEDRAGEFGRNLASVLKEKCTSKYIVLAVDEMIWLRPFNVTKATCLMTKSNGDISTTQLRLGKNLAVAEKLFTGVNHQRMAVASTSEYELFYPYRLPYDFGYVTNVDGVLIQREQFVKEMGDRLSLVTNPSGVEGGWIWGAIATQARQWHLIPNQSKLLNNVLKDGRILDKESPGKESFLLAERFLNDDLIIDVAQFLRDYSDKQRHTHESFNVKFTKAPC